MHCGISIPLKMCYCNISGGDGDVLLQPLRGDGDVLRHLRPTGDELRHLRLRHLRPPGVILSPAEKCCILYPPALGEV